MTTLLIIVGFFIVLSAVGKAIEIVDEIKTLKRVLNDNEEEPIERVHLANNPVDNAIRDGNLKGKKEETENKSENIPRSEGISAGTTIRLNLN